MPGLTLQVVSDLHLESPKTRPTYTDFELEPSAPLLALLGDIGNTCDDRLFGSLETQLRKFRIAFFLSGNHEAYGASVPAAKATLRTFEKRMTDLRHKSDPSLGHFVFLDQTRYDLTDECTILGCTLFSDVLPQQTATVQMFVSDFRQINDWTVQQHCEAHASDLAWLNAQVSSIMKEEPIRSVIILTHHSPTILEEANDPGKQRDPNEVRSAFVTDLSSQPCWTSPQVEIWAFGHTHFNCDFEDPQTAKRVLANQKGYRRGEAVDFDPLKVLQIPAKQSMLQNATSDSPNALVAVVYKSRSRQGATRNKKCIIL